MITIIIILITIIFLLIWFIYNLNSQVNSLEAYISKINKRELNYYAEVEGYYKIFLDLFTNAYLEMQRVDKRGSFSSDDEVGFAFRVILNSIESVKGALENLRKDNE